MNIGPWGWSPTGSADSFETVATRQGVSPPRHVAKPLTAECAESAGNGGGLLSARVFRRRLVWLVVTWAGLSAPLTLAMAMTAPISLADAGQVLAEGRVVMMAPARWVGAIDNVKPAHSPPPPAGVGGSGNARAGSSTASNVFPRTNPTRPRARLASPSRWWGGAHVLAPRLAPSNVATV